MDFSLTKEKESEGEYCFSYGPTAFSRSSISADNALLRLGRPSSFILSSSNDSNSNSNSDGPTDWVIENLKDEESTTASTTQAGENDTLPTNGLCISKFRILPSLADIDSSTSSSHTLDDSDDDDEEYKMPIRLLLGRNGWGTGVHPTTKLCLEWLSRDDVILGGETILDYGCGSGILSIAALGLGASTAVGVDVEAEALVTAQANLELNEYGDRFEGLHTREIVPFCLRHPGAEICVANILIGQLVRPSMVSAIVTNLAPNAYLCMSGIRPNEVDSLKAAYNDHIDWLDDHYEELNAKDTEFSLESYGFDVGSWARVVGRRKAGAIDIEAMSELAVS